MTVQRQRTSAEPIKGKNDLTVIVVAERSKKHAIEKGRKILEEQLKNAQQLVNSVERSVNTNG
jgi:hypothetical protein